MSGRKSKLRSSVEELNIKRIISSGMIVASAFLIVWSYISVTGLSGDNYGYASLIIGICACVQLVFAGFAMKLREGGGAEYYRPLSIAYYAITHIMILSCALLCVKMLNNTIIYTMLVLYLIFVPVCMKQLRMVISVGLGISAFLLLMVSGMEKGHVLEVLVLTIMGEILISYHHSIQIDNVKMSLRLKDRTLSSEQDALTGLMNRRGMEHMLYKIWEKYAADKKSIAFIEMDIDFFKKYNDAFGHPKGDECLKLVANAVKSAVTDKGFVTRSGGEEFIVVLKNCSKKDVVAVAMKIRSAIAKKAIKQAYCAVSEIVTVSMGIAYCIPGGEETVEKMYEKADRELYKAKEAGRNCIVFEEKLYGRIKNGMEIL